MTCDLTQTIAAAVLCENGALVIHDDVDAALIADRTAGYVDPTHEEILELVGHWEPHP